MRPGLMGTLQEALDFAPVGVFSRSWTLVQGRELPKMKSGPPSWEMRAALCVVVQWVCR
jgi:hypothetical protein